MMLVYENHSDTVVIVLHEIYGLNEHIRTVCKSLAKHNVDVLAPVLCGEGVHFRYDQEQTAYRNFQQETGFDGAFVQVQQILQQARKRYKRIYLLGFSIGATVAWRCSQMELCDLVIGFYGSRIRDYLEVRPACPTLLLFPNKEKSFDIDTLVTKLGAVNNLVVSKLEGEHGFADPFSPNYNAKSSRAAIRKILCFIKENMENNDFSNYRLS